MRARARACVSLVKETCFKICLLFCGKIKKDNILLRKPNCFSTMCSVIIRLSQREFRFYLLTSGSKTFVGDPICPSASISPALRASRVYLARINLMLDQSLR